MAPMAGNNDERHLLGYLPDLRNALAVHHNAVVDVIPEPRKDLFPDLDKDIAVIGGDLLQVFSRLFPDIRHILFALFRLRRHILHESDQ